MCQATLFFLICSIISALLFANFVKVKIHGIHWEKKKISKMKLLVVAVCAGSSIRDDNNPPPMTCSWKHTHMKTYQKFLWLIGFIIITFFLQGYEGSLLKVTSKNGKTSSVSACQRPIVHVFHDLFLFPAGGFCDFQYESRCWSSQARSSGETFFHFIFIETQTWDDETEVMKWEVSLVVGNKFIALFCFQKLLLQKYFKKTLNIQSFRSLIFGKKNILTVQIE